MAQLEFTEKEMQCFDPKRKSKPKHMVKVSKADAVAIKKELNMTLPKIKPTLISKVKNKVRYDHEAYYREFCSQTRNRLIISFVNKVPFMHSILNAFQIR
eukprot:344033_1